MAYRDDFGWRGDFGREFERYGDSAAAVRPANEQYFARPFSPYGRAQYNDPYTNRQFGAAAFGSLATDPYTGAAEDRWAQREPGRWNSFDREIDRPPYGSEWMHAGSHAFRGAQYYTSPAQFGNIGFDPYARELRELRAARASFVGRGPKGYRRSDERIREDVCDRLTMHPEVDASEMEVRVANGIVTLSGIVEDRREKRLAEDLAESVAGVDDVHNELKVRRGFLAALTGEKADDREVRRAAEREGGEGRKASRNAADTRL